VIQILARLQGMLKDGLPVGEKPLNPHRPLPMSLLSGTP
jgi:hypothetical protein